MPSWALWAQCIWASALCLTGKYGDLLDFVVIIVLIFYILTIYGIFILRKKTKYLDATGIYKMKLFPLMPILFIAAYVFVGISISLDYKPTDILAKFGIANPATIGLAVMVGFIGLYFLLKKLTNTHK